MTCLDVFVALEFLSSPPSLLMPFGLLAQGAGRFHDFAQMNPEQARSLSINECHAIGLVAVHYVR